MASLLKYFLLSILSLFLWALWRAAALFLYYHVWFCNKSALKNLLKFLIYLIPISLTCLPPIFKGWSNETLLRSGVLEATRGVSCPSAQAGGWSAGEAAAVAQEAASRGREGFLSGFYNQRSKRNAFREEKAGLAGCTNPSPANLFSSFAFLDAPHLFDPPLHSCWCLGTAF